MCHLSLLVSFCCPRGSDLTSDRTERCRPGAVGSFCFSPSHRERMTSCRWGNMCLGPRAGQPPCCLRSGWAGSRSRTVACLARPAGSTSSACSPKKKTRTKREQRRAERRQRATEGKRGKRARYPQKAIISDSYAERLGRTLQLDPNRLQYWMKFT